MSEFQEQTDKFDTRNYMTMVKGGKYLPVAARILWFRHDHPDGFIETEPHTITPEIAIFSARVTVQSGGHAIGYGSCTPEQFRDGYIEKASTKAIGRALWALGYGTPDDSDEDEMLTDSPQYDRSQNQQQYQQRPQNQQRPPQNTQTSQGASQSFEMTAPQKSRIERLASEIGIANLAQYLYEEMNIDWVTISKREASGVIDALEAMRPNTNQQSQMPPTMAPF